MRRRSMIVLACSAAILTLPVSHASAGGAWLDTEREAYAVGERVVAWNGFATGRGVKGVIRHGPFFAYLVRGNRWFPIPGQIPEYAIPIGPMRIERGGVYPWVVRLEFIVPDVPAGRYTIQYCNEPCTEGSIGDLIGGSLFIGGTAEEARLGREVERLGFQIDSLRGQRKRWSERVIALKRELRDVRVASSSEPDVRVIPVPAEAASENRPLVPGWAVIALAAAVVTAALLLRRRRRRAFPDTIPPELVESVQVPLRQPATSGGSPGIVRASPGMSSRAGSPVTKS